MIREFGSILSQLNYPGVNKQDKGKVFRHSLISLCFGFILTILYMSLADVKSQSSRTIIVVAMISVLVLAILHGIYAYSTGQTYWSARIRSNQQARRAAHDSKKELMEYAEQMKKRANG